MERKDGMVIMTEQEYEKLQEDNLKDWLDIQAKLKSYDFDYEEDVKTDINFFFDENLEEMTRWLLKEYEDWQGDYDNAVNDFYDKARDAMEDSWVTGNNNGSYYCDRYKAEIALAHNYPLLAEVAEEYEYHIDISNPEANDVIIRCHFLDLLLYDETLNFLKRAKLTKERLEELAAKQEMKEAKEPNP